VVRGAARVTVNETVKTVHENESIYIPMGAVHWMENPGKIMLDLIESRPEAISGKSTSSGLKTTIKELEEDWFPFADSDTTLPASTGTRRSRAFIVARSRSMNGRDQSRGQAAPLHHRCAKPIANDDAVSISVECRHDGADLS
jgi:hypothetical protein